MKTDKINPADYDTKGPGKFEGEQPATKYYYEQWLNGDGDAIFTNDESEPEVEATLFHIWSDEADAFNIPIGNYFLLWEDNQGFVYGEIYPSRQAAEKAFNSKI